MNNLLSANFYRIRQNKIFWIVLGFSAILSIYIVIANYSPEVQATENRLYLDDVFFTMYQVLSIILAAGISLIVGTEFSDGTIRNKLIIGKTRTQVYFANLICVAVSFCLVPLIHAVITYGAGYFLFGGFVMPAEQVMFVLLCALLVNLVFTALFVAITMNCSNRSFAAVFSLLLAFGLLFLASVVGNALMEPEMTYDGVTISMEGVQFGDLIENPAYVSGFQRTAYEFVYDLLPTGQLTQMFTLDFARCARWPVFSVGLFILITVAGFLAFRKKDLK